MLDDQLPQYLSDKWHRERVTVPDTAFVTTTYLTAAKEQPPVTLESVQKACESIPKLEPIDQTSCMNCHDRFGPTVVRTCGVCSNGLHFVSPMGYLCTRCAVRVLLHFGTYRYEARRNGNSYVFLGPVDRLSEWRKSLPPERE